MGHFRGSPCNSCDYSRYDSVEGWKSSSSAHLRTPTSSRTDRRCCPRTNGIPRGRPCSYSTPVPHADGLTIVSNPEGLRIDSPDDVSLQIGRHQSGNQYGFTITFINERLGAISHTGVLIDNAQSFNEGRQAYRDPAGYSAARLTYPNAIQASCSGRPMWLVRRDPSSPHLLAGDSTLSPMVWPDNDSSNVRRWRLSLSAYMQTVPVRTVDSPVRLRTMEFNIVVAWNVGENKFSVEAAPPFSEVR